MTFRTPLLSGVRSGARRAWVGAALLGAVALGATACGIPTQGAARPIASSQVPFNLLSPQGPTTTTTTPHGYVRVAMYLLTGGHVAQVQRFVAPPASLTAVLGTLMLGPTTAERGGGIYSALTTNVKVLSAAGARGAVATVNLNTAFGQISGLLEVLAVAQIVYTVAVQLGTTGGVLFAINGVPTEVPDGTGALVPGPVHVSQYASLGPTTPTAQPPVTPTT